MSVDIDGYLQEISSEKPCGEDLEYDAQFLELEQLLKGKSEVQIGDTFQEAEPPNWREVIKACESLLNRTRDLRVLISYFTALFKTEGFIGAEQGMLLINTLIETRWDTIYPLLDPDDDNDPTERINILMSLCDLDATLNPLQIIPLVESKAIGCFSLRDIHIAEGKVTPITDDNEELASLANIEAAIQDCDRQQLQQTAIAVNHSLDYLNNLEKLITEQVGITNAPSFTELRKLLKEIASLMTTWLEKLGVNENDTEDLDDNEASQENTKIPIKKISTGINSSQDVIKALNQICDYYYKNEPSSPIPLLLKRVVGLVGKDFMEVLKNIAPNGIEQVEFLSGSNEKEQ
jgi:type VI secretion system protein ImpA